MAQNRWLQRIIIMKYAFIFILLFPFCREGFAGQSCERYARNYADRNSRGDSIVDGAVKGVIGGALVGGIIGGGRGLGQGALIGGGLGAIIGSTQEPRTWESLYRRAYRRCMGY